MSTRPLLLLALTALTLGTAGCGKKTEGQNAGECTDGADNDRDGLFDCDDDDCAGAPDCNGGTTVPGGSPGGVGPGTTSTTDTSRHSGTGAGTTDPYTGGLQVAIIWTDVDFQSPADTDGDGANDVGCSSDVLDITIVDPLQVQDWNLGMAEVGALGWTGEDCYSGYASWQFCHPIGLIDSLTEICTIPEIVEGSTTLFDHSKHPFLTYYLDDNDVCFVTGNDVAYYAALGCTELI